MTTGAGPAGAGPQGRMPAIGRLTRRPEFQAAAGGRKFHTGRLTLQARHRAPDEERGDGAGLRVGLTVTKRVGHATERNRIRRRLRAAAKEAAAADPALARRPLDVVLVGRRDAITAPFPTLLADLARAFEVVTRPGSAPVRTSSGRPPRKPGSRC